MVHFSPLLINLFTSAKNKPLLKPGGASYKKSKPDFILSSLLMATLIKEKFCQYYERAVDCPATLAISG